MPLSIGDGGVIDDVHRPGVAYFNKAGTTAGTQESTRNYGCTSTIGDVVSDDITVDQPIPNDDNDAFASTMSDGDNCFPCNKESDDESDDDEVPDGIILDLYQEMQELRSHPLGLDRFSCAEKVDIEYLKLLHLLKELNATLKAFSGILKWAAKANDQGDKCQHSHRRVIHNLYC
jgi:hypothetical protein